MRSLLLQSNKALLLFAALTLSGCATMTLIDEKVVPFDSYRPQVLEPAIVSRIHENLARSLQQDSPATSLDENFACSSALVASAGLTFKDVNYGSEEAQAESAKLVQAIQLYPENPLAWIFLGACFAINHCPNTARDATLLGVAMIEERLPTSPESEKESLVALKELGLVNLAIYNSIIGDHRGVIQAFDALPTLSQEPNARFIAYEHKCLAEIRMGDIVAARATLEEVKKFDRDKEHVFPRWYTARTLTTGIKTYGEKQKRMSSLRRLEGLISLDEGDFKIAFDLLREAVGLWSKNWDARLELTQMQATAGLTEASRRDRNILVKRIEGLPKGKSVKEEYAYYNLANQYLEMERYFNAEHNYLKAIGVRRDRVRAHECFMDQARAGFAAAHGADSEEKIKASIEDARSLARANSVTQPGVDVSSKPSKHAFALSLLVRASDEIELTYPDAEYNLGLSYSRHMLDPVDRPEVNKKRAVQARKHFLNAARADDYQLSSAAYTNLAQLARARGDFEGFVRYIDTALQEWPRSFSALYALLKFAQQADKSNIESRAKAYIVLLDALDTLGDSESIERDYPGWMGTIEEDLNHFQDASNAMQLKVGIEELSGRTNADDFLSAMEIDDARAWPYVGLVRLMLESEHPPNYRFADYLLTEGLKRLGARAQSKPAPWERPLLRIAFQSRAILNVAMGKLEDAVREYERVLEISPGWAPALLGLESIQERKEQSSSDRDAVKVIPQTPMPHESEILEMLRSNDPTRYRHPVTGDSVSRFELFHELL
jgi:tetratricopeptide (TPR) repeat protein